VGSKARAEKIRTYNFKDGRVTDHRLRRSIHQIEEFMKGESVFDGFIAGLRELDKQERIQLMMAVDGQVS